MRGCGLTRPQWRAVGLFAGLVKILLGKISPLELGRSLWLLLTAIPCPPADKSLLAEGTSVPGIIQQFAMSFLAFQGSSSEILSKVFLRVRWRQAPPTQPT